MKSNYNYETQKLKNLEQLKELSFTLVGCSGQNIDLLLRMVEAKEVIERKGKRNNEDHLLEQVELIIDDDSHCTTRSIYRLHGPPRCFSLSSP